MWYVLDLKSALKNSSAQRKERQKIGITFYFLFDVSPQIQARRQKIENAEVDLATITDDVLRSLLAIIRPISLFSREQKAKKMMRTRPLA